MVILGATALQIYDFFTDLRPQKFHNQLRHYIDFYTRTVKSPQTPLQIIIFHCSFNNNHKKISPFPVPERNNLTSF